MEITKIEVKSKSRRLKARWSMTGDVVMNLRHPPVAIMRMSRQSDRAEATIWRRLFG